MNLKSIFGINLHQAHDDDQAKACMEELGFARVYIDAKMHTINTAPGVYEWDWLDKAIDRVYQYPHYPPFLSLLPGVPAWIAPDDPRQKDGFLLFADERVQKPWRDFLFAITDRDEFEHRIYPSRPGLSPHSEIVDMSAKPKIVPDAELRLEGGSGLEAVVLRVTESQIGKAKIGDEFELRRK